MNTFSMEYKLACIYIFLKSFNDVVSTYLDSFQTPSFHFKFEIVTMMFFYFILLLFVSYIICESIYL